MNAALRQLLALVNTDAVRDQRSARRRLSYHRCYQTRRHPNYRRQSRDCRLHCHGHNHRDCRRRRNHHRRRNRDLRRHHHNHHLLQAACSVAHDRQRRPRQYAAA